MLPVDSAMINAAAITDLCDARASESQGIEFKRLVPSIDERGRFELCKDVCAFANADGGDIVYGIDCEEDTAARVMPVGDETIDAVTRRMLQILDSGVEPKIVGIQYIAVPIDEDFVFVLRVPMSFERPHWVRRPNTRNFYVRREVANLEMTYAEVKSAFERASSVAQRTRVFCQARSNLIINQQTAVKLTPGPTCVVHYLPLSSMDGRRPIEVRDLYRDYHALMLSAWRGGSRTLNLDGIVITPSRGQPEGQEGYVQVFREGLFEAVDQIRNENGDGLFVGATSLGEFIRDAIGKLMDCAARFGLLGAAVIRVAVHGMDGYTLVYKLDPYGYAVADRNHLMFPEVSIDRLLEGSERTLLIRRVLDAVWQAFDLEECTLYDARGEWAP